ncbi:MAG: YdbH domain-containing protein [bacterium]|nr:YdbH domain-containing protein [bacterium]
MKKLLLFGIGGIAVAISAVFIGLFFFLKPIVESQIQSSGFQKAAIESAAFSFGGTTLKNLKLDADGNEIRDVKVYTTLADARKRQLTKVEIEGVRLGWPLAASSPSSSTGPLNLYAKDITFKDVILTLATPYGPLPLKMEGAVTDKGLHYNIDATVSGEAAFAKINGKLRVIIIKATRRMNVRYEIGEGSFTSPDVEMLKLTGWAEADVCPGRALPAINAQLGVGAMRLFKIPLEGTTLHMSSTKEKTEALLQGSVVNNSGEIAVDFRVDHTGKDVDAMSLRAEAKLQNLSALDLAEMEGRGNVVLTATGEHLRDGGWADVAQWKNLQGSAGVDMEKLSLPGLMSGAQALGTVQLSLDPATQRLTISAPKDELSFQAKVKAIGNRVAQLRVPLNAGKPASVIWDNKMKTLQVVMQGAEIAALDFWGKKINTDLTAHLAEAPVLEGKLDIGDLSHKGQPRYFVPVRASLQFVSMSSVKGGTGYTGAVSEKNGWISAKLEGRHDGNSGKGFLSVSMPPTNFAEGVAQVAMAFPVTQDYFIDGFGSVALSANVTWAKGKNGYTTGTTGQLYLKDFTCNVRDNVITGINTVMNLTSLVPLTLQQQTVSVGGLNVGLPLTNGVTVVSLDAKQNFSLHSATWDAVGGKITSTPFMMPLGTMNTSVTLSAKALDLQQLFQIAPLEGLTADGKVDGNIPLQINNGVFSIVNGTLQTTGTGVIRYNPAKPPAFLQNTSQQQIIDLKAALAQFHYDSLGVTINGEIGKSQQVQLRIRGKNPLFYAGKPVNFNLNVEGPIENIIRYNPGSNRIPDTIRKQLETYEANHAK